MIFELSTPVLTLGVFVVILGATAVGHVIGRSVRSRSDGSREPFAVIQAAMLGFMALVLAFGLSLAVGRYESRRAAVVAEANAIGTSYLRAQTLDEPQRARSLDLMRRYTDTSIQVARTVPGSPEQVAAVAAAGELQRALWAEAGTAVTSAPTATAPRLYVEGLNEAFDALTTRIAALANRVPTPVLLLELVGAALALGLLALHLATLGRGPSIALLAAALVAGMLFITFDLDRPVRGLINVPADPLTSLRVSMESPPAYPGPS